MRRRGDRHPHVFADLGVHDEPGDVCRLEQQVGSERHLVVADADRAVFAVARGIPAALVELAVGGQIRLRHDAEDPPAVDRDGAVVDPSVAGEGSAHEDQRHDPLRRVAHRFERGEHAVEDDVLHHEILDRIPREAQLGEHRDGD